MKITLAGNLIHEGRLFKAGDVVDVPRDSLPRLKKLGVVGKKKTAEKPKDEMESRVKSER